MTSDAQWPSIEGVLPVSDPPLRALVALDKSYHGMYSLHRACHVGLIEEIGALKKNNALSSTLLEIACGTGLNIGSFLEAGFDDYYGMDLSETAIAVAMMRHPMGKFINCAIDDAAIVADGGFDIVYCASLLEHLEDFGAALRQMIRIAKYHLFVVFFEGLTREATDVIQKYPFDNPDYLVFGKKFAALQKSYGGSYFWNRYSRSTIISAVSPMTISNIEFLENTNRAYLTNETILHIVK